MKETYFKIIDYFDNEDGVVKCGRCNTDVDCATKEGIRIQILTHHHREDGTYIRTNTVTHHVCEKCVEGEVNRIRVGLDNTIERMKERKSELN